MRPRPGWKSSRPVTGQIEAAKKPAPYSRYVIQPKRKTKTKAI
ncbi:hypothetical protein EV130_106219 [Rhizobium azibense]|uniref:Uncharacterized protein n=1 Tax=Rhizobium azibense TaxID=1136135 RepID=A0A4R3RW12_9HYPH|nr:hypothetical protein EV130_106219 [Rhizobium azibense]TCU39374.1 hypothetical protein EV129_103221 [Rhizobium azibense]